MKWWRRLRRSSAGREAPRPASPTPSPPAPSPTSGEAKAELLRVLRERNARSALIAYDGGHDEGGVSSITVSREPLRVAPEDWKESTLPAAEDVELLWGDWSEEGAQATDERTAADERLLASAEEVVCAKWGSFAGEFEVTGRLVVDVDAGTIARHDSVSVTDEMTGDEGPLEHTTESD